MSKQAPHILIVQSPYYTQISDLLRQGAAAYLDAQGARYDVLDVPGALELPAAVKFASLDGRYDGYIVLGCVVRGETTHYDVVAGESARGLMDLSIRDNLAIANGILTCENKAQAISRADPEQKNKGSSYAEAVLRMIEIKKLYKVA